MRKLRTVWRGTFQWQKARSCVRAGMLFAAMSLVAGCNLNDISAPAQAPAEVFGTSEIIALVPAQNQGRALRSGAEKRGYTFEEEQLLSGIGLRLIRFTYPDRVTGKGAIAELEAIDTSATAGVNHIFRVAATGVPSRFDYANQLMGWPSTGCVAQVAVGMIDTDIDRAALSSKSDSIVSKSFVRGKAAPAQHGSDIAAVLLDQQVMTEGKLFNAAVIATSPDGRGATGVDGIVKALDWLASNDVRVVNMSLAGPYNKLLDLGVSEATQRGMTIVAAAGNDGATSAPRYPAALQDVIAVTAVDAKRNIYRNAVQGAHIDIAAPGVDIPLMNAGKLRFVSGTSIAVPFVTARIASDPELVGKSNGFVRSALARNAEDLGAQGVDNTFGVGLLRAPTNCAQ